MPPAAATPGACGTEPTGSAVYIDCVVPPATTPYSTYQDGELINMSMGPNSVFSRTDSHAGEVLALECEYNDGSAPPGAPPVPGDPPNANFCDAQTVAGGYPLLVNANGSFDYYVADGSAGNSSLMNIFAVPGTTFPGAAITCDATHPCVWYVGEDYNDFGAPHVFSNPFLFGAPTNPNAPVITTSQSQLTAAPATRGSAYSFTFAASGGAMPYTWKGGKPLPKGLKFKKGILSGTAKTTDAPGSYPFTIEVFTHKTKTVGKIEATASFTLTLH
ncbi:MAG TPA: Ig domain-containing protein [Acidimicrobiales bacterium]|nr:Ig domain-containing protein [Acidimicrobiales bacterium]